MLTQERELLGIERLAILHSNLNQPIPPRTETRQSPSPITLI